MRIILFLLSIGLGILSFVQIRKADAANQTVTNLTSELTATKANLKESEERFKETKNIAEKENLQASNQITTTTADAADAKRQLAETQAKLDEAKQMAAALNAGSDEAKKQAADLIVFKERAASLESQLAAAKQELVTARADVIRLQAAAARPALGSSMDQRGH